MIEVRKTKDKQFPYEIELNSGVEKFTESAMLELYNKIFKAVNGH